MVAGRHCDWHIGIHHAANRGVKRIGAGAATGSCRRTRRGETHIGDIDWAPVAGGIRCDPVETADQLGDKACSSGTQHPNRVDPGAWRNAHHADGVVPSRDCASDVRSVPEAITEVRVGGGS